MRSRGASPGRRCARPASRTTCAARFRTAATSSTSSTSSRAPKAMPTRASWCGSTRWISRCGSSSKSRKQLDTPGPVMIADTKFAPPPKETIALSMEALIHHFKIVSESFRVPPGDVYQADRRPARRARLLHRLQRRQPAVARAHAAAVDVQPAGAEEDRGRRIIADMVVMIGSLDPVFGEVDRDEQRASAATAARTAARSVGEPGRSAS